MANIDADTAEFKCLPPSALHLLLFPLSGRLAHGNFPTKEHSRALMIVTLVGYRGFQPTVPIKK